MTWTLPRNVPRWYITIALSQNRLTECSNSCIKQLCATGMCVPYQHCHTVTELVGNVLLILLCLLMWCTKHKYIIPYWFPFDSLPGTVCHWILNATTDYVHRPLQNYHDKEVASFPSLPVFFNIMQENLGRPGWFYVMMMYWMWFKISAYLPMQRI